MYICGVISKQCIVNYLGYIYSEKAETGVKSYIKVISDMSEYEEGKPLLIIGIKNAKSYSSNFNILEKKLSDNVFWTYSKFESKHEHDKDIFEFNQRVVKISTSCVEYNYVDIFRLRYSSVKKIYKVLFSSDRKHIYISNGMLYFTYGTHVIGISLKIMDYCGMGYQKRIERLHENKSNMILDENSKFSLMLKGVLGDNGYLMSYLMSICLN